MEKIINLITLEIQGGVSEGIMNMLDRLIDEGDISQKWFDAHEMDLLAELDQRFFECETCGWTLPIEVRSNVDGELVCSDCEI